jgi:hypothetical protein
MLRAYQRFTSAGSAPAIYDDPSRIRDLLVPKPAKEGADASTNPQLPPGQHPSVLRPKDLPTGNVGQATPPGTKPGTPGATANPRGVPTPNQGAGSAQAAPYSGGSRSWTRPLPAVPTPDGTQPGVVVTPPPTGIYYQPSTSSTGRLGSQVMSDEAG